MKAIKLIGLTSLFFTGVAFAATPCDGFELKIQNNLSDNFLLSTVKLRGAEIQPNGIQQLEGNKSLTFTVQSSDENTPMAGEFILHTISLPSKNVVIKYELKNMGLICEHIETPTQSDFTVQKIRLPGRVSYNISNK